MWRLIIVTFAFLAMALYQLSGGADYAPREDSLQIALQGKSIFAEPKPIKPAQNDVLIASADVDLVPNLLRKKRAAAQAVRDRREARKRREYARVIAVQNSNLFDLNLASISPGEMDADIPTQTAFTPEELRQMGMSGAGSFSATSLVRNADVALQGGYEEVVYGDGTSDGGLFTASLVTEPSVTQPTATQPSAFGAGGDVRSVTGDRVNMRGGPGTDFTPVDQLSHGTTVEVLDRADNGWLRLRVVETGQVGWMADWLVTASAY